MAEFSVIDKTLTKQNRDELDELGYTVFHNVIDPDWLEEIRTTFEWLIEEEGNKAGLEVEQHAGLRRLGSLVNKGRVLIRFTNTPSYLQRLITSSSAP